MLVHPAPIRPLLALDVFAPRLNERLGHVRLFRSARRPG
jgi:hypothetical protein